MNRTQNKALSIGIGTLLVALAIVCIPREGRTDLPGVFSDGEMPYSIRRCLQEKKHIELCDPRQIEQVHKRKLGFFKRINQDFQQELNHSRVEGLRDAVNFDIPLSDKPSWYGAIGTALNGFKLTQAEIDDDEVRRAENVALLQKGPGFWVRLGLELGPRLNIGIDPKKLGGEETRAYSSAAIPQYEWNAYVIRWRPSGKQYGDNLKDGIKETGNTLSSVPSDLKLVAEADLNLPHVKIPVEELNRKLLPGEVIELERFGEGSLSLAPVLELVKLAKFAPLFIGGVVQAGFTASKVFLYHRCGIEVVDDHRSKVYFTQLINMPDGPWWLKLLGERKDFLVGAGPIFDFLFITEGFILPKWEYSWLRFGEQTDSFEVDFSKPGIPGQITVSQALTNAYRKGDMKGLLQIAAAGDRQGTDLGVVHLVQDVQTSKRRGADADALVWERTTPTYSEEFTRTRYHDERALSELDGPSPVHSEPVMFQLSTEEFQRSGHGLRASHAMDVAIRTTPSSETPGGGQSLRLTFNFDGKHTKRDELVEFLRAAQVLNTTAVGDGMDNSQTASIEDELAQARALPPGSHIPHSFVYLYADFDPTAFGSVLNPVPGVDPSAEYYEQWLETYSPEVTLPEDWSTLSAGDRLIWIRDVAALGDPDMLRHLEVAQKFIEAAAEVRSIDPLPARSKEFLKKIRKQSLELYPFAAMARMAGNASHLFTSVRLKLSTEKNQHTPLEISFSNYGSHFELPITMTKPVDMGIEVR